MAGANLAGICAEFGTDAKARIKSCEFHFKEQRNKKAQRLDGQDAGEFKRLCDNLLTATTCAGFEAAERDLIQFVDEEPKRGFLKTWITWWCTRRGFIFRAFAPANAPQMNQAEVIHASWANRNECQLSLLDACHNDTKDSLLLEVELKGLKCGLTSTGRGPSFLSHQRERHQREVARAKRHGAELFHSTDSEDDGYTIDPMSKHRPRSRKKKCKRLTLSTGQTLQYESDQQPQPSRHSRVIQSRQVSLPHQRHLSNK